MNKPASMSFRVRNTFLKHLGKRHFHRDHHHHYCQRQPAITALIIHCRLLHCITKPPHTGISLSIICTYHVPPPFNAEYTYSLLSVGGNSYWLSSSLVAGFELFSIYHPPGVFFSFILPFNTILNQFLFCFPFSGFSLVRHLPQFIISMLGSP